MLLLPLLLCCKPADPNVSHHTPGPAPVEEETHFYTLCDFDGREPEIKAVNCTFTAADNPLKDDPVNGSRRCGKATLVGGTWDCVMVPPSHPLVFIKDAPVFRFKVLSPKAGARVWIKLDLASSAEGAPEAIKKAAVTTTSGCWEELAIDFSDMAPRSNWYQKIYLLFDGDFKGGDKTGAVWYFDDLVIPDDDLASLALFKREPGAFAPRPDKSFSWISNSTANPAVVPPERSIDGNWWLFMRGGDGTRAHLGIYTQKADRFSPLGPWTYDSHNPIVPAGFHGTLDAYHAIDPVPVTGPDRKLYLYYKGISNSKVNTVLLATSEDGYTYTRVDRPWKNDCGVADVVSSGGKYYLFVSRRVYEYTDLLSGDAAVETETLSKGGGPDDCDRYSINGQKILRIDGVDKWFMIYQCSPCNSDFPDRFHVALSDDLVHWTKVENSQPLFTRGARGTWDQGAIWAPSTFEYDGKLYMYYEGWGQEGEVKNRDKQYFTPAHSCIGIASCPTSDFLKWCGLEQRQ